MVAFIKVAAKAKAIVKPKPKSPLKFYTTPKELSEMYRVGHSCMAINNTNYIKTNSVARKIYKDAKLWPSCFFAYFPGIKGVTFSVNGVEVARTLLYKDRVVAPIYTIYKRSVDPVKHRELIDKFFIALRKEGYNTVQAPRLESFKSFKIPGVLYNNKYWCPIPYFDFFNTIYLHFDEKTHEFIVYSKRVSSVSTKYVYSAYHDFECWIDGNRVSIYQQ